MSVERAGERDGGRGEVNQILAGACSALDEAKSGLEQRASEVEGLMAQLLKDAESATFTAHAENDAAERELERISLQVSAFTQQISKFLTAQPESDAYTAHHGGGENSLATERA